MKSARDQLLPYANEPRRSSFETMKGSRRKSSLAGSSGRRRSTWSLVGEDDALSDLRTNFAHIQWRKHANDKKIRDAIDNSKRMFERDLILQLSVDREGALFYQAIERFDTIDELLTFHAFAQSHNILTRKVSKERERWTKAIVRDELTRPAEISEMFLKDWERREEENRKRQLKETKLHLQSLKRVERSVTSKKRSAPTESFESGAVEGVEYQSSGEDKSVRALKRKLEELRIEVNKRHRELRRTAKNDIQGQFSSSSFKTGRGR